MVGSYYYDEPNPGVPSHGFLYDGSTYTTLDAPGAASTIATSISGNSVVGYYDDSHGFIYKIDSAATVPAVITVTSNADTLNYDPSVTIAELTPNTKAVTLRDAINAANNTGGSDTIVLQANTHYDLSVIDNYWYGPDALPAINSDITIQGNGATIERASGAPNMRIFFVGGGISGLNNATLTLQDLTISGGLAKGGDSGYGGGGLGAGGAIFNQGTVNLSGVTMNDNEALGGSIVGGEGGSSGGGIGQDAQPDHGPGGGFGGTTPGSLGGAAGIGSAGGGGGGGGGFRSIDSLAWTPPTGERNWPFALASFSAKSGAAIAPGSALALKPC